MAGTKSSRHPWLHTVVGIVGLGLALPVLMWSVAAILPSHNAFTFISSVLVGLLAVPALIITTVALILGLLGRGALRMVTVVTSVMALIVPITTTATTTWILIEPVEASMCFRPPPCHRCQTTPDKTVRYGSDADETAQIYRPTSRHARVLVDIHGGGWNTDASMPATLRWFANRGWLVIRPSYTLTIQGHPTWNIAPKQVRAPGHGACRT